MPRTRNIRLDPETLGWASAVGARNASRSPSWPSSGESDLVLLTSPRAAAAARSRPGDVGDLGWSISSATAICNSSSLCMLEARGGALAELDLEGCLDDPSARAATERTDCDASSQTPVDAAVAAVATAPSLAASAAGVTLLPLPTAVFNASAAGGAGSLVAGGVTGADLVVAAACASAGAPLEVPSFGHAGAAAELDTAAVLVSTSAATPGCCPKDGDATPSPASHIAVGDLWACSGACACSGPAFSPPCADKGDGRSHGLAFKSGTKALRRECSKEASGDEARALRRARI